MAEEIIINVGTLSSWNSLYRNIATKLQYVTDQIANGNEPQIFWDFSYIQSGKISMSTLTAFLSIAYNLRKLCKNSIPTIMKWDPYILRFLSDVNFFKIAKELDILQWHPNLIGGMVTKITNPNSKILFFNDIPNHDNLLNDLFKLNDWKETKREELIIKELHRRIDSLFFDEDFYNESKYPLTHLLSVTVAELIVNSLLHGQDTAFVGFQRTANGITVCICDSGNGFLSSMKKNQIWVGNVKMTRNIDALLNASLMTRDEIGLKKTIDDITSRDGYISLSSVDCELIWKKNNWSIANAKFNFDEYKYKLQTAEQILGDDTSQNNNYWDKNIESYKNFNSKLKGSRITFEIPFNRR